MTNPIARVSASGSPNALRKYMRISDADILEDGYRYALKFI